MEGSASRPGGYIVLVFVLELVLVFVLGGTGLRAQDTTAVPFPSTNTSTNSNSSTNTIPGLPDSLTGSTSVSYVVGNSVYISAGASDHLAITSRVVVIRDTAIIAELKVGFISSHSGSTEVITQKDSVRVGDLVRFSLAPTAVVVAEQPFTPIGAPVSPMRALGMRGMVGLSFQAVAPLGSGGSGSMTQPALQLQLVGNQVGGTAISFDIDARARRTYAPAPPTGLPSVSSSYDGTRVYQAWANWLDKGSGVQVTLGRQFSSALAPVNLFDGATVALDKNNWGTGIFAGTQPAPVTMGFSSQIREYGAYVQLHQSYSAPADPVKGAERWALTLGGISSQDGGQVNRDFAFLQAYYSNKRFLFWGTQEVDYNHGWKVDSLGQPSGLQPTNTFATVQWTLSSAWYLHGGYDNRKNVLLYRDYVSPVTQFDDAFRQGVWAGFSWVPEPSWRAGFDVRYSGGGATGKATSYTAMASNSSWIPSQGLITLRMTAYTTDATVCTDVIVGTVPCTTTAAKHGNGWLANGLVSFNPSLALRLGANAGYRMDNTSFGAASLLAPTTGVYWGGIDADYMLGTSWYLLLSGTYTNGGAESSTQIYSSLSYRF